jgi:hypothetical protein
MSGYLVTHGERSVFIAGFGLPSYDIKNEEAIVLQFNPAILARWLMRGLKTIPFGPGKLPAVGSDFEQFVDVVAESQAADDDVETFYTSSADWFRIGDIGVLDRGEPAFYPVPGISRMSRRWAEAAARAALLRALATRRAERIRGASFSREDIVAMLLGLILMNEPKSRGTIEVHFPKDALHVPFLRFERGMRPQPVLQRMILHFLKEIAAHGVSYDGDGATITLDLTEGLKLTAVERAFFVGLAMKRLRDLGITHISAKKAA